MLIVSAEKEENAGGEGVSGVVKHGLMSENSFVSAKEADDLNKNINVKSRHIKTMHGIIKRNRSSPMIITQCRDAPVPPAKLMSPCNQVSQEERMSNNGTVHSHSD